MKEFNLTPSEQELLQEVRDFKAGLLPDYQIDYSDYEMFKQKFISYGYYGYEHEIATILEV